MTREPESYYGRLREINAGPGRTDVWCVNSPYGLPPQFLATIIAIHAAGVPMVALHPN